jgi:hypothetical protein
MSGGLTAHRLCSLVLYTPAVKKKEVVCPVMWLPGLEGVPEKVIAECGQLCQRDKGWSQSHQEEASWRACQLWLGLQGSWKELGERGLWGCMLAWAQLR